MCSGEAESKVSLVTPIRAQTENKGQRFFFFYSAGQHPIVKTPWLFPNQDVSLV